MWTVCVTAAASRCTPPTLGSSQQVISLEAEGGLGQPDARGLPVGNNVTPSAQDTYLLGTGTLGRDTKGQQLLFDKHKD